MALQYPLLFPLGERGFQVGIVYDGVNVSYRIPVFWSDPTFLPRGHTEWPFGLCFHLRHEPFATGWMWFHVWVLCKIISYWIQVFWSNPTFLPRDHTEWPFGLCFRLPSTMLYVSRPFSFRHEPFAPGWTWFHVWVPCITEASPYERRLKSDTISVPGG